MQEKYLLKKQYFIFFGLVFLFFFVFYNKIHPVIVHTPDDWSYIGFIRKPFPIWRDWNPGRIFPETFMGLCGHLAAHVVAPLTGDYIYSFTLVTAFVLALFLCFYVYAFCLMIQKHFGLTGSKLLFVAFVFLVLHFLVSKNPTGNSRFMLKADDLTCHYFYLIPYCLGMRLAFLFVSFPLEKLFIERRYLLAGLLLLAFYLAIFSNMLSNIAMLALVFSRFIQELLQARKYKIKLQAPKLGLYSYIFILAIGNLLYEAFGNRAKSLPFEFPQSFLQTLSDLRIVFAEMNRPFILLLLLIGLFVLILFILNKEKSAGLSALSPLFFASLLLCSIYQFLLLARIGANKALQSENIVIFFIYPALLFSIALSYLLARFPKLLLVVPLLSFLLFFSTISGLGRSYKSYPYVDGRLALNRQYIASIVQADREGWNSITLPVDALLKHDPGVGWRIARSLYAHHLISRPITVEVVYDPSLDLP